MWLGGASEKAAAGTVIAGAVAGCEASFLARGLLSRVLMMGSTVDRNTGCIGGDRTLPDDSYQRVLVGSGVRRSGRFLLRKRLTALD